LDNDFTNLSLPRLRGLGRPEMGTHVEVNHIFPGTILRIHRQIIKVSFFIPEHLKTQDINTPISLGFTNSKVEGPEGLSRHISALSLQVVPKIFPPRNGSLQGRHSCPAIDNELNLILQRHSLKLHICVNSMVLSVTQYATWDIPFNAIKAVAQYMPKMFAMATLRLWRRLWEP
jgi:hypothetical protein